MALVRSTIAILCLTLFCSCGGGSGAPDPGPGTQPPPSGPPPVAATPPPVRLVAFVTGLQSPVGLESLPDGRLFVIEQAGRIKLIQSGVVLLTPFLDIQSKVTSGGELGLLGLAFHPLFAQNRRFYVNYTRAKGSIWETVIAEYTASAGNPSVADPAERILLTVDQPFSNHNGGQLAFGPDGFLYIGLGDGGNGGDPQGNAQNLQSLLGKMLRIDVNGTSVGGAYGIPADNPFAGGGGLAEIYAYGFRNPWRFSLDAPASRFIVADVGQGSREEIDILQRNGNFGWNRMEGSACFPPGSSCNQTGLVLPVADYDHSVGQSITGGFVYRGSGIPQLAGFYVFGDFVNGRIFALREETTLPWRRFDLLTTSPQISISSFGRDSAGELYVVDYSGSILRLSAQ